MNTISEKTLEEIRAAIKRLTGTVFFEYHSDDLMNPDNPGGIILDLASGNHIFRVERTAKFCLNFYHASAGTGTRLASIDLKEVPRCNAFSLCFTWSPEEINIHLGPRITGGSLFSSKGVPCKFQLRVGSDKDIYWIGDDHVEVMGAHVYQGGNQTLSPTAIESWKDTKKALEILKTGKSDEGYVYDVMISNLTISLLVTGFETYTKKRIVEMEGEGIAPDIDSFLNKFLSKTEKDSDQAEIYKKDAEKLGRTLLEYMVAEKGVVNFQNYDRCKCAFAKLFKIRFDGIGIPSDDLSELKKFIAFRHRIIHVSALSPIFNQSDMSREDLIFSNKELADKAEIIFNLFISKLHDATLRAK